VGEPKTVNPAAIAALLNGGLVPVISSIGYAHADGADQLLNVNADTVAGSIAGALDAGEVLFLTDVEGVRGADSQVIPQLSSAGARDLIASGVIAGGMIPKVEACLHATAHGVRARILDGRLPGAIREAANRGTAIVP
jgi:acetylglutamate kinase